MFKDFWRIFVARCKGPSIGESVYTENGEYAGLLWTNDEARKKWIVVCWDYDDEFCPQGMFKTEEELSQSKGNNP